MTADALRAAPPIHDPLEALPEGFTPGERVGIGKAAADFAKIATAAARVSKGARGVPGDNVRPQDLQGEVAHVSFRGALAGVCGFVGVCGGHF